MTYEEAVATSLLQARRSFYPFSIAVRYNYKAVDTALARLRARAGMIGFVFTSEGGR